MRSIILAGMASLAGGGAYLSGAVGSGEYYPLPPAEVSAKLAHMPLPDKLSEADSGGQLQLITLQSSNEKVRWQLLLDGDTFANVDADLAPTWTGGTRVSIDFRPAPEGADNEKIVSSLPLDDDFVDDVIEMAIGEQADAYLENRAFNEGKLKLAVAGYTATHPGKARALAERMRRMSTQVPTPKARGMELSRTIHTARSAMARRRRRRLLRRSPNVTTSGTRANSDRPANRGPN